MERRLRESLRQRGLPLQFWTPAAEKEAEVAIETLLDGVAGLGLAPGYVFDPNPVFWALGPRTLRVTLTRA